MVRNLVIATVDRKRQPDRSVPSKPIRANGSHPGRSRIQSVMWLVLVAALGASLHVHLSMRGAEADPAPLGQDSGFPLTRGPFEVIIASHGVIQPSEVVDVGAQVSGQLSTLLVKLGDRVESGQPLAEIDDRRIRARLVQGEAAIDTLRAQISAKQAQHAHARIQQARTETLSDRNIASRAQAELVQTTTSVLAAEVRSLEAQLAGQEAAVEGIRLDLSHTRITAPVDGVVTAIVAQRGRTLNANQQTPVILRISRDRPLILVARVPEADAERVQPGMSVRFTPAGGSSQTFEGIVGNIMRVPTIVNGAVFYDAFIELDGERHFLPFGRSAQAFIIVERLDCAVLLPRDSLPDGAAAGETIKVTLRNQAGHLVVRVLKLRGVNEVNAAIACEDADKAGITASDRVVNVGRYLRMGA